MTNAEIIKGMTSKHLAEFLFKFGVVEITKGMEMKFNELLNAKDMLVFLESEDNTIINQIMSKDWNEVDIDFTPFMELGEEEKNE